MDPRNLAQHYRELAQRCRDQADDPHHSENRDLMLELAADAEKLKDEQQPQYRRGKLASRKV